MNLKDHRPEVLRPWEKNRMRRGARNTNFRANTWRAATGDTYNLICLLFFAEVVKGKGAFKSFYFVCKSRRKLREHFE